MTDQPRERSLLVVDDEPDICANLKDILTDFGYRVDTASSGPEALEHVRRRPYDAVLLDLKMPGMDGVETYRRIKQLASDTVAIIVTAYASGDAAQSALEAGAWGILPKPVDLPHLVEVVDKALAQPLVLIVDDDHDLCQSLWDVLRNRGFRVSLAHTLDDGVASLDGGRPFHAAIIDMKLPQGNGKELFDQLRTIAPDVRTILVTGYRSEVQDQIEAALAEGADAVAYKPFDLDQLLETLQRLVRH